MLHLAVKRHAEMMPHHKRHENGAWRLDVLGYVECDGDRDGGDSSSFYCTLDQRDRLVADRSGGREQRDVRALCFDGLGDVFGERAFESLGIHVVADEGEEVRRKLADHAF